MKKWNIIHIVWGAVTFILLLLVLLSLYFADVISPLELTITRITVIRQQILRFAHLNNRLPMSLRDLPERPGSGNSIKDGWERDIEYSVDDNGVVTLRSLGSDGVVGGERDAADIIEQFKSKMANGEWLDELSLPKSRYGVKSEDVPAVEGSP